MKLQLLPALVLFAGCSVRPEGAFLTPDGSAQLVALGCKMEGSSEVCDFVLETGRTRTTKSLKRVDAKRFVGNDGEVSFAAGAKAPKVVAWGPKKADMSFHSASPTEARSASERLASERLRCTIERQLPVRIGDDWDLAQRKLSLANLTCKRGPSFPQAVIFCDSNDLQLEGAPLRSLLAISRGGLGLDGVSFSGELPEAKCGEFLGSALEVLGEEWRITSQVENRQIDAEVPGDRSIFIECASGQVRVNLTDAWVAMPTDLKAFFGGTMKMGGVLYERTSGMVAAGKTLGRPRSSQGEIVQEILSEFRRVVDAAPTSTLSPRSRKAFDTYVEKVTSPGWYEEGYMAQWDK
jgi:hypothetical protein